MEKTVYAYNNAASAYEEKFSRNETYKKHALFFADMFRPGDDILDIGCGPGLNSALFSGKGLNVTGVDSSVAMIKLAEKNCPEGRFVNKAAADFKAEKRYDGICMAFVIVHMKDSEAEKLINRIPGMIKEGGKVYISFMTGKNEGYETTSFSEDEFYFNYFDAEKITAQFENNGFKLISSRSDPYEEADGSFTTEIFLVFEKLNTADKPESF